MKIRRPWKSGVAADGAFVAAKFGFTDSFAVRASNNERLCGVAGSRHLDEAIVVTVRAGQLHIEVVAVWKSANGLRRNKNIFRKSRHGSPH